MKNFGWDLKYALVLILALIASAPLFLFEPLALLIPISLVLAASGVVQIRRYRNLASWVKVSGTLLETDIGRFQVSEGQYGKPENYYFPLAQFAYACDEFSGESNRYAFDRKSVWSKDLESIKNVLAQLEALEELDVFVNPSSPHEAALNIEVTSKRRSHSWALVISGCLLGCVGALIWLIS